MVAQDLVVSWEDAYRRYVSAPGREVTETSRAVAGAWRDLAACADLPWWLSAAVRSAAQAFEQQAETWTAGDAGRDDLACVDDESEYAEDDEDEHGAYHRVALPAQQSCACTHAPPTTGTNAGTVVRAMA
jgi:hypothetical protein